MEALGKHLGEILSVFFYIYAKQRKEQVKIEYDLSALVAMDCKRPIATFFVAVNYTITEVYNEKI